MAGFRGRAVIIACAAMACGASTVSCTGKGRAQRSTAQLQSAHDGAVSALRRLSRDELDNTLRDVLGETRQLAATNLAADPTGPFDNDAPTQQASGPLIEGLETIAAQAASAIFADSARRAQVLGCTPTGAGDAGCMGTFVRGTGKRLFRRPLTEAEAQRFISLGLGRAQAESSFDQGAAQALRALLQSPAFVYRNEQGAVAPGGSFVLTDYEIASRLSYFLWGSAPDAALLAQADAGQLKEPAQRRTAALRMLADPRAIARIKRFHALWLGYHRLPHPAATSQAMLTEADALVERVIFTDNAPWTNLFTSRQAYVNSTLTALYGMTAPSSGYQWMSLPTDRQGILSTGAVLSVAAKFGDTSPTMRGKYIRESLMCMRIPPPPPDVNVDAPPESPDNSPCKWNRYSAHRVQQTSCNNCHRLMDPIGFGLEKYDQMGRFRSFDLVNGAPDSGCPIQDQGEITGVGTFRGPAQLSDLLLTSGAIQTCAVQRVFQFAMGHEPDFIERTWIIQLAQNFQAQNYNFRELLVSIIAAPEFAQRRGL